MEGSLRLERTCQGGGTGLKQHKQDWVTFGGQQGTSAQAIPVLIIGVTQHTKQTVYNTASDPFVPMQFCKT